MNHSEITTLGQLKASGWKSRSVKEEIREHVIEHVKNKNQHLFPGIVGYNHTVIPQIIHALMARHDMLLLGLRGQAKTRLLRSLVNFLDEFMPIVKGSEINDDPLNPLSKFARELVADKGDETPIEWIHRSKRYVEKLATPDTTVADLIGDIDPIKAASQKLTLSDEDVISFGLIPRANRSIFVINELPDLQPRIQVALLNILQEKDIQIRGFNVRIPLDVSIYFSANPEDYTNRGNIITPLKDRIDAQILTHYPKEREDAVEITRQEAWEKRDGTIIHIPHFVREILEEIAFQARTSEYIDQKSGVSARMSITAMEQVISAAERRAVINSEDETTIRISDIYHIVPALTGKLELVYEGEQEGLTNVAKLLIGKAVNEVYKTYFPDPQEKKPGRRSQSTSEEKDQETDLYDRITRWFMSGNKVDVEDTMSLKSYKKTLNQVDGLEEIAKRFGRPDRKEDLFVMMEFILETLHQNSMLSKYEFDEGTSYSDMLGSMLSGLDNLDDLDDYDDL